MLKKAKKYAIGIGIGTIGLGAMSDAIGKIGGDVAAFGQAGITNIAKVFPIVGNIGGADIALSNLKKLKISKKLRWR